MRQTGWHILCDWAQPKRGCEPQRAVLDLLEELLPTDRGTAVLHWFTGSASETRRALDLGCYFSVNEMMLASASGQRVVQVVPIERLLTETDGPFVQRDGTPIPPARAVEGVASLQGRNPSSVQIQILRNLQFLTQ